MIQKSDPHDDALEQAAEAYEQSLLSGEEDDSGFASDHPELAKSLRMLHAVFLSAPPAVADESPPTSHVGRFQLVRRLGSGSFGTVWLANDPVMHRDVALKIAHVGTHAAPELRERFQREAQLAARLHHPHIVPVFETGEDDGHLYIVSEYCEGSNLAEWLKSRQETVDPDLAARIVRDLADAAEHAHRQGLIHRDIKPENVLLDESGTSSSDLSFTPRLTDFGLARDLATEASMTRTGMVMGTAEYMSPEQATANREQLGPASDVYSLGVLLYRLLTGHVPFAGPSEFEVIQQIVQSQPTGPSRHVPQVSRDLNSICLKCLEKLPEKRYHDGGELRDDLNCYLRGEPTTARPIPQLERLIRWTKRSPAVAGFVAFAMLTVSGLVFGLSYHLQQAEQHAEELEVALHTVGQEREAARSAQIDANNARAIAEQERETAREIGYRADMRLAFQLWDQGRLYQVREILERQHPGMKRDLRGAEWCILNAELNARQRILGRHDGIATECVLSADQKTAYTAGVDGVIRIWNLKVGTQERHLQPEIGAIHALALAPDGQTLAIGGRPEAEEPIHVHLVDAQTGEHVSSVQNHLTTIESLTFSPDGRWLAGGSRYQPIQLSRLKDGETFSLESDRRHRLIGFSPDSRLLAIEGSKQHVSIWRVDSDAPKDEQRVPGYNGGTPYLVQFDPQSQSLVTAYTNRDYVIAFDETGTRLRTLFGTLTFHSPSANFQSMDFSRDSRWFAAGDEAGRVLLWEPRLSSPGSNQKLNPTVAFDAHESRVNAVRVTNASQVFTSGDDGRVCQFSPFAGGAIHLRWDGIRVLTADVYGDELFLGCDDGSVRRQSLSELQAISVSPLDHTNDFVRNEAPPEVILQTGTGVRAISVSHKGDLIAVGTTTGGVGLYDRLDGQLMRQVSGDDQQADPMEVAIYAVEFSRNDQLLACTGRNRQVALFDVTTGATRWTCEVGHGFSLSFLQNDQLLACGNSQEQLLFLDVTHGRSTGFVETLDSFALALNSSADTLAVTHGNGRVSIFDALSLKESRSFTNRLSASSVVFAAQDRTLLSIDQQGHIDFASAEGTTKYGRMRLSNRFANHFGYAQLLVTNDSLLVTTSTPADDPNAPFVSDLYIWSTAATLK